MLFKLWRHGQVGARLRTAIVSWAVYGLQKAPQKSEKVYVISPCWHFVLFQSDCYQVSWLEDTSFIFKSCAMPINLANPLLPFIIP